MPTTLPLPAPRARAFPWLALGALLFLGLAPVIALFTIGAVLDRGCTTTNSRDGEAGTNMVWRIEVQRCGGGPEVTNVLLAPRGKSLALVASSTGTPRPVAVVRDPGSAAFLQLEAVAGRPAEAIMLPLKATGRPAQPLVLSDGQPRR